MALSDAALARLRQKVDSVKQRQRGGEDFGKYANLSGKSAIVQPGGGVLVRLGPRWDYAQAFLRKDNKIVVNPAYDFGADIYVAGIEHWFDGADGKRHREWCPRMADENAACPLDEAAEKLFAGDAADKELAKDIRGKDVFLFNAVIRKVKDGVLSTVMGADGKPDWRILAIPPTVFTGIFDLVLGGGEAGASSGFALGEVWDPREGRDLMILRPAERGQGQQYKVQANPKPGPLVLPNEAEAWRGWMGSLHDLEAEVKVKTYDELFLLFYGQEAPPDDGAASGVDGTLLPSAVGPDAAGFAGAPGEDDLRKESVAAAAEGWGDFAMPGAEAEPPAPAKTTTPPSRPAARKPASPSRPTGRRR